MPLNVKVIFTDVAQLTVGKSYKKYAAPPRYDAAADEPAFEAAYRKFAALQAEGKTSCVKPEPTGGIRMRRSRSTANPKV